MKKFNLQLRNAAEDYPRMLLGAGTACGGTFTLVIRVDEEGVWLAHKVKKEFRLFVGTGADAPGMPTEVATPDAVKFLLDTAKSSLPAAREPSRRGTWKGWLICDDQRGPIVMLERNIASYGMVRIVSDPEARTWTWKAERAEKWFAGKHDQTGVAKTLTTAIKAAYAAADGLVAQACTVRDTTRRSAKDAAYAERHPNRLAAEGPDPTARGKKARKGKADPTDAPPAPKRNASASHGRDASPRTSTGAYRPGPGVVLNERDLEETRPSKRPSKGKTKDERLLEIIQAGISTAIAGSR